MSRRSKFSVAILAFVLLFPAGYFGYMGEQGKFHPVRPGGACRSDQPDRDKLDDYIKKSVLSKLMIS